MSDLRNCIANALDMEGAQRGDCGHEPGDAALSGNGCWALLLRYAQAAIAEMPAGSQSILRLAAERDEYKREMRRVCDREKPAEWALCNPSEFHSKSSAYGAGYQAGWDARV